MCVIDCDLPTAYTEQHIPGAGNPADHYYKTSPEDRTHIQTPQAFAETMRRLGISDDTVVVAYDRSLSLYAFRLAWALHYYRHVQVKVLDGGLQKWVAEGRPTEQGPPAAVPKGTFTIREPDKSIFAGKPDVLAAIADPDTVILDVRAADERDGTNKRGGRRGGFIPSSAYLEWKALCTEGDIPHLRSASEIASILSRVGVVPSKHYITHCQGGIRAAHTYWAMRLAGFENVRNYDGSWREWDKDLSCPIVEGPVVNGKS